MPKRGSRPSRGNAWVDEIVAARVMNPPPVTAAAPLLVSMSTSMIDNMLAEAEVDARPLGP